MKRRKRKPDKKRVFQNGLVYMGEVYMGEVKPPVKTFMERNQEETEPPVVRQENIPDNCLNDTGKLLRYYRSSTAGNMVFVSDAEASHFMRWSLKKQERIKRQLREMKLISYCVYDSETKSYFFYLL